MQAVYLNENHYQQLNDNYLHLASNFLKSPPTVGEIQSKFVVENQQKSGSSIARKPELMYVLGSIRRETLMSEAIDTKSSLEESLATDTPPSYVRPGSEQDTVRGDIPAANDLPLEDINPVWNRLFAENRMLEYFERLRRDDPVHFQ